MCCVVVIYGTQSCTSPGNKLSQPTRIHSPALFSPPSNDAFRTAVLVGAPTAATLITSSTCIVSTSRMATRPQRDPTASSPLSTSAGLLWWIPPWLLCRCAVGAMAITQVTCGMTLLSPLNGSCMKQCRKQTISKKFRSNHVLPQQNVYEVPGGVAYE
jgi:hypothetical protein